MYNKREIANMLRSMELIVQQSLLDVVIDAKLLGYRRKDDRLSLGSHDWALGTWATLWLLQSD
jgi:hypothetical protein